MKNEDFAWKYSLTVYETVKYIGICERKVREMVKNDQIPYYRVGRSVRIPIDELNIWLRNGGTKGGHNGEAVHIGDILKPMVADIETKHIQRNNGSET